MKRLKKLNEWFECGGPHLSTVRRWMQGFPNGSRVTWGSLDQLGDSGLTVKQLEDLAEDVKDAVIREVEKDFNRLQEENAGFRKELEGLLRKDLERERAKLKDGAEVHLSAYNQLVCRLNKEFRVVECLGVVLEDSPLLMLEGEPDHMQAEVNKHAVTVRFNREADPPTQWHWAVTRPDGSLVDEEHTYSKQAALAHAYVVAAGGEKLPSEENTDG